MAESFIFKMLELILPKMGSYAVQEIGLGWDAELKLRKLKKTMYIIRNVLLSAEEQQISNIAVEDWLERLKFVVYDIDDLLDEFEI